MICLIASDGPAAATRLRKALAAHGHDVPITHVLSTDRVAESLQSERRTIDLLLMYAGEDSERFAATVRNVRAATRARIVAVGPAHDPARILAALHAGADDYLDEQADLDAQLGASLGRAHSAKEPPPGDGRLIAVTSASGGNGASTVAVNLAALLAHESESCGLIDLDAGFGDLAALLNLNPRYTLADLCRDRELLDQNMLTQSQAVHPSGIRLIAAPLGREEAECIGHDAVLQIVEMARSLSPWTVLDLDLASARRAPLQNFDHVLLIVRLDFSSLCNARRLLEEWRGDGQNLDRVLVVANRCGPTTGISLKRARVILDRRVAACIPEDALVANLCVNCGNPVVLEQPHSSMTRSLADLARTLRGTTVAADGEAHSELLPAATALWRRAAAIIF